MLSYSIAWVWASCPKLQFNLLSSREAVPNLTDQVILLWSCTAPTEVSTACKIGFFNYKSTSEFFWIRVPVSKTSV